ncbi:MAG: hypothetical protein ASARMPRED_002026 [Alectoria sarmentosa]|nr:MAG: hypothetical protein ASARMPRED_002026 [Alectoria sarmentosa]
MAEQKSIPIVDLSAFGAEGNTEARLESARALYQSCHDLGFVQILGHGVEPDLLREAFDWSEKLYSLSHDDKMKAPHPDGPVPHRGYSHPGLEKVYSEAERDSKDAIETDGDSLRQVKDFKESYEIGSEDNSGQQNIWLPEEVLPGFRSFMMTFYWKLDKAAHRILEAVSLALGLTEAEKGYLFELHSGHNNQLRLLHYPPIPTEKLRKQVVARMPAHCDWSSFTMLFQDDCGGLEFEDPNNTGSFVPAAPTTGALALNIGDMLQRFSNDVFPSASHRVTLPPRAASANHMHETVTRQRFSIPYFVAPDADKTVSCFSSCVSDEHPVKFEPVSFAEYGASISRYQYKRKATVAV